MSKIDKHFTSEIDKKLAEFDSTHIASPAQQAEFNKHQRIYQLRDVPTESCAPQGDLWD